jgi:hypothetical protein
MRLETPACQARSGDGMRFAATPPIDRRVAAATCPAPGQRVRIKLRRPSVSTGPSAPVRKVVHGGAGSVVSDWTRSLNGGDSWRLGDKALDARWAPKRGNRLGEHSRQAEDDSHTPVSPGNPSDRAPGARLAAQRESPSPSGPVSAPLSGSTERPIKTDAGTRNP